MGDYCTKARIKFIVKLFIKLVDYLLMIFKHFLQIPWGAFV